jgi:hypothetical protein
MRRKLIASARRRALLVMACVATALIATPASPSMSQAPRVTVEIRSYNLKPGARNDFHKLVLATLPMLERHRIDVVGYGPSAHDSTSYVLIRTFESAEDRERSEEGFYGSREWQEGPREQVLALIESYTTVVLALDSATVAGLRTAMRR